METPEPKPQVRRPAGPSQPLLIAGATGTLGKALARACEWRGIDYRLTSRAELDLSDDGQVSHLLDGLQPWAVVNATGWVRVDDAETEADGCLAANHRAAAQLARACRARGLPVAAFSSDLVFNGEAGRPYVERDEPCPLNVYGASKAAAEREILRDHQGALVVRTAAFFSPFDPYNFAAHLVRALSANQDFPAADDLVISPTYVPDLADAVLDLMIDGETGLWHLANEGAVSWAAFGRSLAEALGLDAELVRPTPSSRFGWPARRPRHAPLASERCAVMPTLDSAIARYAAVLRDAAFAAEAEAQAEGATPSVLTPSVRVG